MMRNIEEVLVGSTVAVSTHHVSGGSSLVEPAPSVLIDSAVVVSVLPSRELQHVRFSGELRGPAVSQSSVGQQAAREALLRALDDGTVLGADERERIEAEWRG